MKLTAESTVINDSKLNNNIDNAQTTADGARVIADEAKTIADDTAQFFWFTSTGDDTGAHISEKTRAEFETAPSGGNLLARSNGIAVRDGLTELATFGAAARVGKTSAYNVVIDEDSIAFNKNGEDISNISNSIESYVSATTFETKTAYGKARVGMSAGHTTAAIGSSGVFIAATDDTGATGESDTYSSIGVNRSGGITGQQKFHIASKSSTYYGTALCEIHGQAGLVQETSAGHTGYVPKSTLEITADDISINNAPLADFVVEQSTSGNWRWHKWSSGIVEAWYLGQNVTYSGTNTAIALPHTLKKILCLTGNGVLNGSAFTPLTNLWCNTTNVYISFNATGTKLDNLSLYAVYTV